MTTYNHDTQELLHSGTEIYECKLTYFAEYASLKHGYINEINLGHILPCIKHYTTYNFTENYAFTYNVIMIRP